MNFSQLFAGPEHMPFLWEGMTPAALLVHGFPGTPAEMRPLAEALQEAGWTVQGLLLPGFGREMDTLPERSHVEWTAAVSQALATLQQRCRPTLLIGYSMGAAVALAAASQQQPDGLVLMAPLWRLGGPIMAIVPLMARIFSSIQPFRLVKLDFSDPNVRQGLNSFMPGVDLTDPEAQRTVRDLTIPISIVVEVRKAAQAAERAAPAVKAPTLVVQGAGDRVIRPATTRQLVLQLPGPVRYREVPAAHDLLNAGRPAWPLIVQAIQEFGHGLIGGRADLHISQEPAKVRVLHV